MLWCDSSGKSTTRCGTTLKAKQQATWLLTCCFRAEIQKLDDTHHRLDEQRRTKQYRQTVATRPKVANRHVRHGHWQLQANRSGQHCVQAMDQLCAASAQ
jgi:hypothetical protein